jgi:hypothetical protein
MKHLALFCATLMLCPMLLFAHDNSSGAMNVETKMSLEDGNTISIKHRPLLVGSGATWDNLKAGKGVYKIGEVTTSAKLTSGETVIPAGTHPLFYSSDGNGKHFLHFGGTWKEPGKLKAALRSQQVSPSSKYMICSVSHGSGFQDIHVMLVYGELMGRVSFHVD